MQLLQPIPAGDFDPFSHTYCLPRREAYYSLAAGGFTRACASKKAGARGHGGTEPRMLEMASAVA